MEKNTNADNGNKSTKNAALLGGSLLGVIVLVGVFYLITTNNQIYTDKADIEAPSITISAAETGTLKKLLVTDGDQVAANTPVAQVGDQILRTNNMGIVIDATDNIGKTINSGDSVVTLIDPAELRLVAHIDEDKGLNEIKVGQLVTFTVDAYGSKKYDGTVAEISQTSHQSGVVFNISDQREIRQFDVKMKFNDSKYPELKNGMSAKVTIFKK